MSFAGQLTLEERTRRKHQEDDMTRSTVLPLAIALCGALIANTALARDSADAALSVDDCRKIWNLAAGRSDLGRDQAKGYVDDFAAVDDNGDGKISNMEFLTGCEKGLAHPFKKPE